VFLYCFSRIGWAEGKNPHKIILQQKEDGRRMDSAQVHVSFISKQVRIGFIIDFSLFYDRFSFCLVG
jgi:hypothetical protein